MVKRDYLRVAKRVYFLFYLRVIKPYNPKIHFKVKHFFKSRVFILKNINVERGEVILYIYFYLQSAFHINL